MMKAKTREAQDKDILCFTPGLPQIRKVRMHKAIKDFLIHPSLFNQSRKIANSIPFEHEKYSGTGASQIRTTLYQGDDIVPNQDAASTAITTQKFSIVLPIIDNQTLQALQNEKASRDKNESDGLGKPYNHEALGLFEVAIPGHDQHEISELVPIYPNNLKFTNGAFMKIKQRTRKPVKSSDPLQSSNQDSSNRTEVLTNNLGLSIQVAEELPKLQKANSSLILSELKAIEVFNPSRKTEVELDFYCALMKDCCRINNTRYNEEDMLGLLARHNYNMKHAWQSYVISIKARDYYQRCMNGELKWQF